MRAESLIYPVYFFQWTAKARYIKNCLCYFFYSAQCVYLIFIADIIDMPTSENNLSFQSIKISLSFFQAQLKSTC